jgi:hypothetical protein
MFLKIAVATLLALVGASVSAIAAPQQYITVTNSQVTPSLTGDCNGNGRFDIHEAATANRDSDGDGVCNGVDACPFEAGSSCQMQAITVPANAEDFRTPHVTYSGATLTLKGIARYGGNQFMWDFGDGSSSHWSAIANAYNLGMNHVYTGAVGQTFVATLHVRNSANPGVVASDTFGIVIKDGGTDLALLTREQTDVRAQMAIDKGLWYLHTILTRGTFSDGAPGYAQPYALLSGTLPEACLVTAAFAAHGHVADRTWSVQIDEFNNGENDIPYRGDPYVESTRLLLTYIRSKVTSQPIGAQSAGNPDVNGNSIGLAIGGDDIMTNSACAMAFGEAAGTEWFALSGPANVYARTNKELSQDMTDWLAHAQTDAPVGGIFRGGWGGTANSGAANSLTRWVLMALMAQESRMGATIPAFVRSELPYWLQHTRNMTATPLNGSTGWAGPDDNNNVQWTAGSTLGAFFTGDGPGGDVAQRAMGFIAREWQIYDGSYKRNLGDLNTMFSAARMFRTPQRAVTAISDFDYVNNVPVPSTSFSWYYGPAGSPQLGYAGYVVGRQAAHGPWTAIMFDINGFTAPGATGVGYTALATMVLAPSGVPATVTASQSALEFGDVEVSSTSTPQVVTLTNDGDYNFPLGTISATGPFQVLSLCAAELSHTGAGTANVCEIHVTFAPGARGDATGVLTITGASGLPMTIALSGTGVAPKAVPSIAWAPSSMTYGTALGAAHLNATSDAAGTFEYSPAAGTMLDAGVGQVLTVTFTPSDPTAYLPVTTTTTIDVTPATPSITIVAAGATYDGQAHPATATAAGVHGESLGPVTITYNGLSDAPLTAGTYIVAASIAADGNYSAASASKTIVISKATPVVAVTGGTYAYDGGPHAAAASATGVNGEELGPISLTYNGLAGAPVDGGTYTVVASLPASTNYLAATATTTIVIEGAPEPTNTAPVCFAVTASTRAIWPANGQWINVSLSGATDAEAGALQYRIASIFQDEATDSTGDRNTAIDGGGVGTSTAQVRAERQGNGNGRVYHIGFVVTDQGGLSCSGSVTVSVAHNQKAPAIDGGPLFDSTIATAGRAGR